MVRRLPADVRRAEIVQVAQEAMAELGFRRLSLREVARRAGMSAPGVAKHFPTMESLLEAVLAWRDSTELTDILVAAPADVHRGARPRGRPVRRPGRRARPLRRARSGSGHGLHAPRASLLRLPLRRERATAASHP
ncbi:MAG: helix-turn-helix transcriptional regulator [Leifsonia sp.]|nr:helix-turn-helix transcriptional regulator [Leifsonia sp.]